MVKILMIADDFTGALDSGVQFAGAGLNVKVVTDIGYDFRKADRQVQVLVLDTETRHVSKEEAYNIVYQITKRGRDCGIPYIYKKTDSALRGNIGAELQAVLDASGEEMLPFFPALPGMGRVTKNGIQLIDGVPVACSIFGKDPFNPVTSSYIPEIIGTQGSSPVTVIPEGAACSADAEGIVVFDAESGSTLMEAAGILLGQKKLHIMAGCAGLASVLPELLGINGTGKTEEPLLQQGFFVVCGSINPITRLQIDYAEHHGFYRKTLTAKEKLQETYWSTDEGRAGLASIIRNCQDHAWMILDTNDPDGSEETKAYAEANGIPREELRRRIPLSVGYVVQHMMEAGIHKTLMITGGDTLMGFLKRLGVGEMVPICELFAGTVLSRFTWNHMEYYLISKSGGFGGKTLLKDIAGLVEKYKEEKEVC